MPKKAAKTRKKPLRVPVEARRIDDVEEEIRMLRALAARIFKGRSKDVALNAQKAYALAKISAALSTLIGNHSVLLEVRAIREAMTKQGWMPDAGVAQEQDFA